MAKNDIVLIDSIIEERRNLLLPSDDKGEVFEFLACEQILKNYDLTKDEISQGIVDGKDDGGIDAMFIFVNGSLYSDTSNDGFPKKNCDLSIYIITCKHHNTFKQDVVNNQCASISELFDFSKDDSELKGSYNSDLLQKRQLLKNAYSRTASALDSFSVKYFYCSRGNSNEVGENIIARASQIEQTTKTLFSNIDVGYHFYGGAEILTLYRKRPPIDEVIPIVDVLSGTNQCYVVLCKLVDYYRLIASEDSALKKYLFDSNVRDYMGENGTNSDILDTLRGNKTIDFWWLNNGITILSTSAINIGKAIKMQNTQIVNGLQTSITIHKHFTESSDFNDNRCVLIKIITQADEEIRDKIIVSTNNQTKIEVKSLFATDKIQRDIEDILKKYNLYYERRINFYSNQGIDTNLTFDIMYLATGYIGLILKSPEKACTLKQKHLRVHQKYSTIFNEDENIEIWPIIAKVLRETDRFIKQQVPIIAGTEKMIKRSRYSVALITLGRLLGSYTFSSADLINFDFNKYTNRELLVSWDFFLPRYEKTKMISRCYVLGILKDAGELFNIDGAELIAKRNNIFIDSELELNDIPSEVVQTVRNLLPAYPWPKGLYYKISKKTGFDLSLVSGAIRILKRQGLFAKPKNYDDNDTE